MQRVKANTTIDEQAQLLNANNEIARLKQLLAHALKRGESGNLTVSPLNRSGADPVGLLQENMLLREENEQLKLQLGELRDALGGIEFSSSTRRAVGKLKKKGKHQQGLPNASSVLLHPLRRQDEVHPARTRNNNVEDIGFPPERDIRRSKSAYPLEYEVLLIELLLHVFTRNFKI